MDMPNSLTLACGLLAAAFAAAAAGDLPLVPYPASVKATGGESRGAPVSCVRDASIKPEGYRLSVGPGAVEIRSADAAGELYARKTLGQLRRADGSYPCVEVEDAPKFPWRGLHFDDATHFFGRAAVLKTIETMAEFKLNVLHWHLVDNEGWRLPVPGYPQLTNAVRGVENRLNFPSRRRMDMWVGNLLACFLLVIQATTTVPLFWFALSFWIRLIILARLSGF